MKLNLKKFKITSKKPLPVDDFIEKILYEPKVGYYSSKNPFGKNGDFITSPIISNLFSEIVGIWLVSAWEKMGKPTDSGAIYNILSSFGMSDDNIKAVGTEANVSIDKSADAKKPETPAGATAPGDKPATGDTPAGGTGAAQGGTGDAPAQGGGDAQKGAPAGQAKDPKNDGPFDMQKQTGTNAGVVSGDFEWKGAQWINNKTGKIADKATAAKLGNPKLAELAREIEKAGVGDLV